MKPVPAIHNSYAHTVCTPSLPLSPSTLQAVYYFPTMALGSTFSFSLFHYKVSWGIIPVEHMGYYVKPSCC